MLGIAAILVTETLQKWEKKKKKTLTHSGKCDFFMTAHSPPLRERNETQKIET